MSALIGLALFALLLALTLWKQKRIKAWQVLVFLILSSLLTSILTPTTNKLPPWRKATERSENSR